MNFELTKEQTLLKKAAQQFAENILEPSAAELDETHTFPVENFKLMARYGFTGIGVPKEYGGVGGGMTGGDRTVRLSKDAEAQGASGVVVNAPMTNDVIEKMAKVIDIPTIATVLSEKADIQARLDAGVSILNVSAAARTPEVVSAIREKFPKVPIIATGGPTGESIARTIGAGANSISYTPPSTKELFSRTMEDYRSS